MARDERNQDTERHTLAEADVKIHDRHDLRQGAHEIADVDAEH